MHGNATPLLGEDHSHFFDLKSPSFSSLVVAVRQPYAGHALAQASLFHKLLLQCLELLVEEVVCLMKQTNRDIGDDLRRASLHELAINLKSLRRFTAKPPDKAGFFGFLVPHDMIPHAEEIPIVRK